MLSFVVIDILYKCYQYTFHALPTCPLFARYFYKLSFLWVKLVSMVCPMHCSKQSWFSYFMVSKSVKQKFVNIILLVYILLTIENSICQPRFLLFNNLFRYFLFFYFLKCREMATEFLSNWIFLCYYPEFRIEDNSFTAPHALNKI